MNAHHDTRESRPLVLLDGGMGRELQDRGLARRGSIWSALALMDAPDVVADVHRAFVGSGADVITTSNYSAVPQMLEKEGLQHRFDELTAMAGEIAANVKASSERFVRVAGSLPPLSVSYQPDAVGPEEENFRVYERMAEILAPHVDLFICETMSTGREARAAARAAVKYDKPVWVAWTLDRAANTKLRSGETVCEAFELLNGVEVEALLFNCSSPEAISAAMASLRACTDAPIGGYANAFGERRSEIGATPLREDVTPEGYAAFARSWRAEGASIIGGCCGISPAHIACLHAELR